MRPGDCPMHGSATNLNRHCCSPAPRSSWFFVAQSRITPTPCAVGCHAIKGRLTLIVMATILIWGQIGGVSMDRNGYTALAIGVLAIMDFGIGPMGLVFHCSCHGHE